MSGTHTKSYYDATSGYKVNGTSVIDSSGNVTVPKVTTTGQNVRSVAAITAGTTQTQAGATAITTDVAYVTTGNASDGVRLPSAVAGMVIEIINASANAGVVYGTGATSTNTINGTAGATGVAYAASKTLTCRAVSATAWVTTLSN